MIQTRRVGKPKRNDYETVRQHLDVRHANQPANTQKAEQDQHHRGDNDKQAREAELKTNGGHPAT